MLYTAALSVGILMPIGCEKATSTAPSTKPGDASATRKVTATVKDAQTITQDKTDEISVVVNRDNYKDDVTLQVTDLPKGVTVETKDLTGFGALLNAAVGAIGNSLTLHGLQFDIEDKSALLAQARELAFQEAKEKAAHLAALSGYSLGSVTAISETQGHVPMRPEAMLGAKGAYDSAINVVPGDETVVVSLQVHFAWA